MMCEARTRLETERYVYIFYFTFFYTNAYIKIYEILKIPDIPPLPFTKSINLF